MWLLRSTLIELVFCCLISSSNVQLICLNFTAEKYSTRPKINPTNPRIHGRWRYTGVSFSVFKPRIQLLPSSKGSTATALKMNCLAFRQRDRSQRAPLETLIQHRNRPTRFGNSKNAAQGGGAA